jgi:putative membrane protein
MVRMALSILVQLIANAIGLVVAASVLDDMTLDVSGFLMAVGVFTLVNVLVLPLLQRNALKGNSALSGSTALGAAFIALVITVIVTDGLTIDGLSTWVVATIIVWAGALIGTLLLPVLVFKRLREDNGR